MNKFLTAALAALFLATPIAASAQDVPSYQDAQAADQQQGPPPGAQGQPDGPPSYAEAPPQDEQIRGRITSFDGAYSLEVRDERGFIDRVQLHQGTIINPTGLTLAPGMTVSILGYNSGDFFAANEIDTPYTFDSGVPYYAGHPWDYYGPTISLGFFFGDLGWWHGDYFHGGFVYRGGARYYSNVRINNIYRNNYYGGRGYGGYTGGREPRGNPGDGGGYTGGRVPRTGTPGTPSIGGRIPTEPRSPINPGTFRGRDFVAPRERGGYYHSGSAPHASGGSRGESHSSGGDHRAH